MTHSDNHHKKQLPIGVFDSGMGGLTVLKALSERLPHESFIYLGDTARLPYGTKSSVTVINYALQMSRILVERNIKLMVIACNTATTAALQHLIQTLPDLPIIGVVEPGAATVAVTTKNKQVAILATETTINSGVYQQTIQKLDPTIQLITQSCGLFVALTEEGCVDDDIAHAAISKYLSPIIQRSILPDTVLLGCTHFPVLKNSLQRFLGSEITLVDSAAATATRVFDTLTQLDLHTEGKRATFDFLVTDLPERFVRKGPIFLGQAIASHLVSLVDC